MYFTSLVGVTVEFLKGEMTMHMLFRALVDCRGLKIMTGQGDTVFPIVLFFF